MKTQIQTTTMIWLLTFIVLLSACSEMENPAKNTNKSNSILFLPSSSQIDEESIIATLTIYKTKEYSNSINNTISYSGIDAAFYNGTHSVWAGDVTLNGPIVPHYSAYDSTLGVSLYAYGVQPYPAILDGRLYSWNVSGSNDFVPFSISLNAPYYEVDITNLSPNQVVSKNSDLVINWDNLNSPTAGVKVMIVQGSTWHSVEADDLGTISINSANLSQFSNGEASLVLYTGNYAVTPIGNMNALALIYSSHELPIIFGN